jgi:hypothetical protein
MKTFRSVVLLFLCTAAGIIFSGACGGGDGTSVTVISSITPANEATDVALASPQVTVVFGTDIDPTVLNSTNVILTKTTSGTIMPGTISYDAATKTMILTPTPSLAYQTGYTLTLKQAIHSALTADVTSTFTVKDVPLALLSTYNPNDPATPFNVVISG